MVTPDFISPQPNNEAERLQGLGFERFASSDSSNFVLGGGLLIENNPSIDNNPSQRLYAPFKRINSGQVEAIQLSDKFNGIPANGICVQVIQKSSPVQTARWGEQTQIFELASNGSSGGRLQDNEFGRLATESLVKLSQKSIEEQLEDSGFVSEIIEGNKSVLRYRGPQGELVAVIEDDLLQGIFVPFEQMEPSIRSRILDPSTLKIVGIRAIQGYFDTDPERPGVTVSNGWAEFTIDHIFPSQPQQLRIVREPSFEELGVPPIERVTEQTGFVIGGANSTETIRNLR
jgi:hypothetical protein